jgi:DeoR/GlpR family transcriptional regulator of sugar metabolism
MGASSFDPSEAELARAMVRQARRTVLLADHSKIGVCARVAFCGIEQVHQLITNKKARDSAALDALAKAGCALTLV